MAEYYTKAESDARYAGTSHTHALEDMGGNNLPADRVEVPESVCASFDNAYTMDEALVSIADQFAGKANASHTHSGYAAASHTHSGYAAESHTHDGYAAAEHTHDYAAANHGHSYNDLSDKPTIPAAYSHPASHPASMITGLSEVATSGSYDDLTDKPTIPAAYSHPASHPASMITGLADVATSGSYNDLDDKPTIPTVPASLPANGGNADTVDGKHASDFATAGHTHTASDVGAAPASHTHNYASSSHTHTASEVGAAAANHGHTGYADEDHTHTAEDVGALPSSGGTVDGALTVTGAGTIRGKTYTQQILPMDSGSYSIGASDNRYYSTYLRVNPNVSSDRRCKRDVAPMDIDALAAFVDKLSVVNYNYNDDAADEAKRIGLIAQDVVAADPTIAQGCIEQDEKGFYSLRAADLVFPLIAAVQALTKRVEELEGK